MPARDDDHLVAQLRRLLAAADPVPAAVQAAACTAFGARTRPPKD